MLTQIPCGTPQKLASLSLILEEYFQTTLLVLFTSITMFSSPTSCAHTWLANVSHD